MFLKNLFAKNPFGPLKEIMGQAQSCVNLTEPLFEAVLNGDQEQVRAAAKALSVAEGECGAARGDVLARLTGFVTVLALLLRHGQVP